MCCHLKKPNLRQHHHFACAIEEKQPYTNEFKIGMAVFGLMNFGFRNHKSTQVEFANRMVLKKNNTQLRQFCRRYNENPVIQAFAF